MNKHLLFLLLNFFLLLFASSSTIAASGDLQITCEPGIKIYVDGQYKGETNSSEGGLFIDGLSPGQHSVRATKAGYQPFAATVTIESNKARSIAIRFKASTEKITQFQSESGESSSQTGTLELRSAPMGATVAVNGKKKDGITDMKIEGTASGTLTIQFSRAGKTLAGEFTLPPGGRLSLKADFRTGRIENLSAIEAQEEALRPGRIFRDCSDCPEMVVIPAGTFQMGGSGAAEPVHVVTIGRAFAMGRTEVTQGQWKAIMGNNPSKYSRCGDSCPVETVTWDDAQAFIRALNAKTGKRYRLPSEAEWEHACRGGATDENNCGSDDDKDVGWVENLELRPVAQLRPNRFGLYDMTGNVWEHVQDGWHPNYVGAPTDGSVWESSSGAGTVVRGRAFPDDPNFARVNSAYERLSFTRGRAVASVGFRVARMLP